MKQIIDIENWKRKEHYRFFKDFTEPFFGITANLDCTKAYRRAKEKNVSFFLYYMHKSLLAVNAIEEFKYRTESNGDVAYYDKIHGSTTTMNANEMFAFAFLRYTDNFEEFYKQASQEIAHVRTLTTMNLSEDNGRPDVIHYSTIPWVSFTGLSHDRNLAVPDSIPKLTFGKYFKDGDKLLLPLYVNVHHGMMDGYHAGKYFEVFQKFLDEE